MADTYTSSLRIAQETIGGNENSWGTINNAALSMLDEAIAGQVSVSVTAGDVTLTTANNTTDQSRPALLILTGSPGVTRNVTMPDVKKLTHIYNNCSDGSSIIVKSGAGTSVTIPAGGKAIVYSDGATNCAVFGPLYQEGTFTPVLSDGAGNNFTLSTALGFFRRIGNVVFYEIRISWTSIGAVGAGQLQISGLPYVSANLSGNISSFVFGQFEGLDTQGGVVDLVGFVFNNTSTIFFRYCQDNSFSAGLPANTCSATGILNGSGVYFI